MRNTSTRGRKPTKAPKVYGGAFAALWACTLTLGVFGASGWVLAFWGVDPVLAVIIGGVFLAADLVAGALCGPLLKTKGGATKALLGAAVFILVGLTATGYFNSFSQFERTYFADKVSAFELTTATLKTQAVERLEVSQGNLKTTSEALANLPTPSKTGEITRRDTYLDTVASLEKRIAASKVEIGEAKADLASAEGRQMDTPHLLPPEVAAVLFGLVSLALILSFLGVHLAEHKATPPPAPKAAKRKQGGMKAADWIELATAEGWTPEGRPTGKAAKAFLTGQVKPEAPEVTQWRPQLVANDVA